MVLTYSLRRRLLLELFRHPFGIAVISALSYCYTVPAIFDYGDRSPINMVSKLEIPDFAKEILMKLLRVKQIEDNQGNTLVSEGVKANYQDIINYSVFALIKLTA